MRFTVPQFIEYEAKIIGPFTFKQFIYIGIAGAICFVFYFTIPFGYFLIVTVMIGGGALALAFLKIGGRSLPRVLFNFLMFSVSPKIYIWRRRKKPAPKIFKKRPVEEEIKKAPLPKKVRRGWLEKLSTRVKTHK